MNGRAILLWQGRASGLARGCSGSVPEENRTAILAPVNCSSTAMANAPSSSLALLLEAHTSTVSRRPIYTKFCKDRPGKHGTTRRHGYASAYATDSEPFRRSFSFSCLWPCRMPFRSCRFWLCAMEKSMALSL
jgi:hypothetical protein